MQIRYYQHAIVWHHENQSASKVFSKLFGDYLQSFYYLEMFKPKLKQYNKPTYQIKEVILLDDREINMDPKQQS